MTDRRAAEAAGAVAVAPDGTVLPARVEDGSVTVFVSEGRWRRAPADAKAIEGGSRFLLVDVDGKQRVARVAAPAGGR